MLAALSVAVGLALPGAHNPEAPDAEAQGVSVHQGYTYTQRQCQELGRQPRRYNVREPIAGSDWRNDGGWAIVLIRSQTTRELTGTYFDFQWSYVTMQPQIENLPTNTRKMLRIDYRNGRHAYVRLQAGGFVHASNGIPFVAIDRDKDGDVDNDDRIPHPSNPALMVWEEYLVRTTTYLDPIGATYTRWANMLWCR